MSDSSSNPPLPPRPSWPGVVMLLAPLLIAMEGRAFGDPEFRLLVGTLLWLAACVAFFGYRSRPPASTPVRVFHVIAWIVSAPLMFLLVLFRL